MPGDLCVLGDLNVHFDLLHNPTTTKLLDFLRMFNLYQTVKQPTHRQGHIIDWVIERPVDGVLKSTVVSDALESVHKCVIIQFDVNIPPPPHLFRHVHNLGAIDRAAFKHDHHSELARLDHPSTEQYNSALQTVPDKHAPASKRKVSVGKYSPWFSLVGNQLLTAKRLRQQAEQQWRSTGLTIHKELYNKAKHHVTKLVRKAKSVFLQHSDCRSSIEQ